MKHNVMIVEDEKIMRVTLEDSLKADGFEVCSFENGSDAVKEFRENQISLVISDVRLPDMNGLDVLRAIKKEDENAQVIMMTAYGTIKDAVEAMKQGAYDYITKPFSLDELSLIVKRALDVKELREENMRLRKDLSECYAYQNIIGESVEMVKIFEIIRRVAKADSTVLVLGESGTGKELIATAVHYQSQRKNRPLIKVNCGALPDSLIESELFGYEKGAFTGAVRRKPGRFELADKGTIFLDEVGDLPPSTQVKLLRVLQDGSLERLGGTETIKVNVRIIAATNKNLAEEVKKGFFREDLYYRLNVIPLSVPSLRKRRDDIPLLLEHFIKRYNDRFAKRVLFTPQAIQALMKYDFPGNIRELENLVERCIALSEGESVDKEDLPSHILKKGKKLSPMVTLTEITTEAEKEHLIHILKSTKGNKTKAAEILGISRKTLWEKLNLYGIKM